MNLDEHHTFYVDTLLKNTDAVFQLLGGWDCVYKSWRTSRERLTKEILESEFRLLGGKVHISLEFDHTKND